MSTPLVSVLLPTRGRVAHLERSLKSLAETIDQKVRAEIIVRCDDDDLETKRWLEAHSKTWSLLLHGPRGQGYADLHLMYDDMCRMSRGQFLFMWNDDNTMQTTGWDLEIAKHASNDDYPLYLDTTVYNGPEIHHYVLPIVHRSYWHILGRYSASAHNDTYIYEVLHPFFDRVYRPTNIVVQHHHEMVANNDRTYLEGKQVHPMTKRPWKDNSILVPLREDREKIARFLAG